MNNIKQSIKSFTERRRDVEEKINKYLSSPGASINTEFEMSKNVQMSDQRGSQDRNSWMNSNNPNRILTDLHSNSKVFNHHSSEDVDRQLIYSLNEQSSKSNHIFAEGLKNVQMSDEIGTQKQFKSYGNDRGLIYK